MDEPLIGSESQRRARGCALHAAQVVLAAALTFAAALLITRSAAGDGHAAACGAGACLAPQCMHALGGGNVGRGGEFPHLDPDGCTSQISDYITSGAYLGEVEASIASALASLGLDAGAGGARLGRDAAGAAAAARRAGPPAGSAAAAAAALPAGSKTRQAVRASEDVSKALFVFDIDETALSNVITLGRPRGGAGALLRRGSHAEWDAYVAENASPALAPTLRFYQALCAAGYPVAFVTGRGERVRTETAANLLEAGYGRQCPNATASAAPGTPGAAARRAGAAATAGPAGAARSPAASASAAGDCCYVDLMLRPPGDERLASVYKPWARQQLQSRGWRIFGSIGDQFSDLAGETSAPFSVKLPNVFYYIL